jgi:hypothetical protein
MLWSRLADETNPSSANASTAEPSEMRRIAKPPIGPRQPRGVPPRRESLCFGGGQSRRQCCLATVGGSATVRLDTTPIEGPGTEFANGKIGRAWPIATRASASARRGGRPPCNLTVAGLPNCVLGATGDPGPRSQPAVHTGSRQGWAERSGVAPRTSALRPRRRPRLGLMSRSTLSASRGLCP